MMRVSQIKFFADGIPTTAETAWLHQPYLDGRNGGLLLDGATIDEQVRTLHELIKVSAQHGFQVGTHSTGDATIDAVDGYLATLGPSSRGNSRPFLVHVSASPAR
ncbi:MAG TPA: amidohydrolase family protein [Kutzneria sp.]|jgi:predicted amidohydrolase YtcJ|nr:amidohydrolase family protein [Kutzneria sp.]